MNNVLTIYDFRNNTKSIPLPDTPIESIEVKVLLGDETGIVRFIDGTVLDFDASNTRYYDFCDAQYTVDKSKVQRFLEWVCPKTPTTFAYARAIEYWGPDV